MPGTSGGSRRTVAAFSVIGALFSGLLGSVPAAHGAAVGGVTATASYDRVDSVQASGAQSTADAYSGVSSADAFQVAFVSFGGLVASDTNGQADVYRRNHLTGTTNLVSTIDGTTPMAGNPAQTSSATVNHLDISNDGSKVFFLSDASYPGAPVGSRNLFVRDFSTNTLSRVNVDNSSGSVMLLGTGWFSASADGTKVAFLGQATASLGATQGIYIRDLTTNTTSFAYYADAGGIAMSGDGTHVAFLRKNAATWAPLGFTFELYIWHFDTENNYSVAVRANNGTSSNFVDPAGVLGPNALNHDGSALAFWSDGDAFVGNEFGNPAPRQVFTFAGSGFSPQLASGTSTIVGNADSATAAGGTEHPRLPAGSISADGTKVAFTSYASNLDSNASSGGAFVKNRTTGAVAGYSIADTDWTVRPVLDTTLSANGGDITFSTGHNMTAVDTDETIDVFTRSLSSPTSPPTPTVTGLSLTAGPVTRPGFSVLDSADVPATALPLDALGDVSGTPLRSIDVASTPLRSIPLRSIPLRSIPLRSIPLRSITLSELPLHQGTWEAIVATITGDPFKGVPLQAITLDDVLASDADMSTVTLGNVDLASTPLRSISISSILLGATPLRSIPVGDGIDNFADWCAILAGLGYSCEGLGLTPDSTVLAVDLAGIPLRSIPLRSIPLRSIPLRSIDLATAPLRSIPLRSINYGGDLGSMELVEIKDRNSDGTLGASNPGLLVNCAAVGGATCASPKSLTDAATGNAFLTGKTLGDLVEHVAPDAITGSLGELIASVVDAKNYPWENLPLDGLQPYADGRRIVAYEAAFTVNGSGAATAVVSVTLPAGFRYVAGSTDAQSDGVIDEPSSVVDQPGGRQKVTWSVATNGGDTETVPFEAHPGFELVQDATSDLTVAIGADSESVTGQAPVDVVQDWESQLVREFYPGECTEGFCQAPPPPGFGEDAPVIQPNNLIVGHIGYSGDEDLFRIPVPPKGTRMQIRLGNHSTDADFDVAMFNTAESTPLRSIPLRSIPLRSIPLADNGVDATAADSSLSPETLNDIPNIEAAPLRSIGENRGTADEFLSTVSNAEPVVYETSSTDDVPSPVQQYYTLQVTAYNGGSSNAPYVLYVSTYQPPPPPTCPAPKTFANAGQGTAGSAPTLPANLNTLFLVNKKRLGDTWGSTDTNTMLAKLNTLAGRDDLGVIGAVYAVESDSGVSAAYTAWDADPCSVEKANATFTEISAIVDSVKAARPTLENIVVVGGDDIVPMARVADYTQLSNESDYGSALLLSSGTDKGTPYAAAAITQNILTDDPLGDVDPIPWLDHALYVPDMAVGRLVETPAEIDFQVQQFIDNLGVLGPQTSLTTGYDFLTDGAEGVDAALANGITDPAKRSTLINETWSKGDVLAALFPAGGTSPDIATVNAHYDHNRALPALGNSTHDESDLVTADEMDQYPLLTKRLLFTMGCHAGMSVPKSYTDTAAKDVDWAQTYAQRQAAVYFANTGFGYGDTTAVALSEELMRQFASRLDGSMTVGEAAVYAKQAYFGQLGAYGPYDEKAMQEATLYGLPMWKVTSTPTAPPAPVNVTPAPDANGVNSAPVSLDPSFTKKTSKGGGTYFEASAPGQAASGLQVTQYRPIEPRISVDVTPSSGGVAHGVLITDLSSKDEAVVPAMARPVIDLSANEPAPPAGDVSFPTSFQNLTTFNTPSGQRQHVVFLPGQFFRDASWNNAGGVQRLFETINAEVKYSDSTDFTAPHITDVNATLENGTLTISMNASDGSGVVRVLVLVKDASGEWTPLELTLDSNTGLWVGALAVTGTDVEYFAQAMDANGNIGVTTNKGRYFTGLPEMFTFDGTPDLILTPGQATGSNGWYRSAATVDLIGNEGVTYTVTKSVNGGSSSATGVPTTVSADGVHLVKAVGSDGSRDVLAVAIDKTAPTYTGATPDRAPNANGWYNAPVSVSAGACTDATSGVHVCPGAATYGTQGVDVGPKAFDFAGNSAAGPEINLDSTAPGVTISGVEEGAEYTTMPNITCTVTDALSGPDGCTGSLSTGQLAGNYTYTATGKDKAGNTTVVQVNFKLVYIFSGFLQPVNDTAHQVSQTYSVFAGGSTVPLKFHLSRPDGTRVQAQSTPTFLTPVRMNAISGGEPVEQTPVALADSGFDYKWDSVNQQYQYNWKTDKKSQAGYYWKVGVLLDGVQHTVIIGLK